MAKREKTEYIGVYYTMVNVPGGKKNTVKKLEKCFLVTFKRPGDRKQREETVGRASQNWTAAQANIERAKYINGKLTKSELEEEKVQKLKEAELEEEKNKHLYFTVDQAMTAYLTNLNSDYKLTDESRYRLHIKPYCANKPVSKLEPKHLLTITTAAIKNELEPQTRKHILGLLRRAIIWAKGKKLCTVNDDLKFEMPKFKNVVIEHYTEEEIAILLRKVKERNNDCPVGSGIIECIIFTGLRPSQVTNLKWVDISYDSNQIKVHKKSTVENDFAMIPLNSAAKNLFERMPKIDKYVFPSSRGGKLKDCSYQINKALDGIDLPDDFRPLYSLRHNFASWFANVEGANIFMLMELLTHSSVTTTQRYAHLFDTNKKDKSDHLASMLSMSEKNHENSEKTGRIKLKKEENDKKI
jgi:integrase